MHKCKVNRFSDIWHSRTLKHGPILCTFLLFISTYSDWNKCSGDHQFVPQSHQGIKPSWIYHCIIFVVWILQGLGLPLIINLASNRSSDRLIWRGKLGGGVSNQNLSSINILFTFFLEIFNDALFMKLEDCQQIKHILIQEVKWINPAPPPSLPSNVCVYIVDLSVRMPRLDQIYGLPSQDFLYPDTASSFLLLFTLALCCILYTGLGTIENTHVLFMENK